MRLRNVKGKDKLIKKSEYIILNPNQNKGVWSKVFNNSNPIYVEIGMGFGKFIIENAKRYPNINFIGIEKFDNVVVRVLPKLENEIINNLKIIRIDAAQLMDIFAPKEISRIYLNFSDPWPKNKHAKRRLTSPQFLKIYENILNGEIHQKTDNNSLFEYSIESLSQNGYKLKNISLDLKNGDYPENIPTEYEEKWSEKGKSINRLEAYKE